jgi:small subunit ribosomal protein S14
MSNISGLELTKKILIPLQKKYEKRRKELVDIKHSNYSSRGEKFAASQEIQKLPRRSSKVRQINRCCITGRTRAYYGITRLTSIQFRDAIVKGLLPGFRKARL